MGSYRLLIKLDILRNSKVHSFGDWDIDEWRYNTLYLNDSIFNYDILVICEAEDIKPYFNKQQYYFLTKNLKIDDDLTCGNYQGKYTHVKITSDTTLYGVEEYSQLVGVYGIKF